MSEIQQNIKTCGVISSDIKLLHEDLEGRLSTVKQLTTSRDSLIAKLEVVLTEIRTLKNLNAEKLQRAAETRRYNNENSDVLNRLVLLSNQLEQLRSDHASSKRVTESIMESIKNLKLSLADAQIKEERMRNQINADFEFQQLKLM